MKYGLTEVEIDRLRRVFSLYDRIDQAILYGSRAKGTYKPFSDIDLTLIGKDLTAGDLRQIWIAIDDLLLPYEVDLSLWADLSSEALKEHIARVGVVLYAKPNIDKRPSVPL